MYYKRLLVSNVRNLEPLDLTFSPSVNVICGLNGSGKTSFLESLSILSSGKSFRSHLTTPVIARDQKAVTVFGEASDGNTLYKIGVEKSIGKGSSIRLNQKPLQNNSALARLIPLLVIDHQSFELLTGGSKFRRSLLDWLVFHVEQNFHVNWLSYREVLKQRNALLKLKETQARDVNIWAPQLSDFGEKITDYRAKVFEVLATQLNELSKHEKDFELDFRFDQGWKHDQSLKECLLESFDQDRRYQTTKKGPHRADLLFTTGGKKVTDVLSRGQLKTVVCRFFLALANCYKDIFGNAPIILIDDLPAELDKNRAKILLRQFLNLGSQLFVTGVDLPYFSDIIATEQNIKVFHVEHGIFKELEKDSAINLAAV